MSRLDLEDDRIKNERTICVLGDLHSRRFSSLVKTIEIENPDIILMAVDIFDESDTDKKAIFETIQ